MVPALAGCLAAVLLLLTGCAMPALFRSEEPPSPQAVDERIVAEISTRYLKNGTITYLDIQPYSYGRHVYLVGEAGSPEELDLVVTLAKSVQDVRSVTTYVLPKPEQPVCSSLDNARIQSRVLTALDADGKVAPHSVNLTVFQCVVVLTGEVDSRETEAKLLSEVQTVDEARKVKSLLRVVR